MFLNDSFSQNDAKLITEAVETESGKNWYMEGICMQSECVNRNGRNYPYSEIRKAVAVAKQQIDQGFPILGEADHPDTLSINIDRISHVIENIYMNGNDAHARLKILDTPMGKVVESLLRNKIPMGVSSRGSGDLDHNNTVSNFEFVTVDIVATPSAPKAYPRSIYESLMDMDGGNKLLNLAGDSVHDVMAQEELAKRIHKFINVLQQK